MSLKVIGQQKIFIAIADWGHVPTKLKNLQEDKYSFQLYLTETQIKGDALLLVSHLLPGVVVWNLTISLEDPAM